ncbi:MAG TPA: oligopeptide/dipeptide ABC transporter ATP-binding protein [Steroidobacteraceae bacterium]|nr:oligopeptide/dipeptide ABC transporter ATP-binding protein [Steroidobacteraceae bacterium]
MTGPLVDVTGLVKHFYLNAHDFVGAINGISFGIAPGETLGLVGESGSGKTTVGRCLLRLLDPTDGQIRFDGLELTTLSKRQLRDLRPRLQIVFQDPLGSLNPRRTVRQTVEEPLILHTRSTPAARMEAVSAMLQRVNLGPQHLQRYPIELTASEQQRVGIARALITKPALVVLDEPTSTLDPAVRAEILLLLADLQADLGAAYLFISHDLMAVERISHRVAVMYLGHIVELAPAATIIAEPRHPYTKALMSAVLSPDPRRRLPPNPLHGEIPSALNPRAECPFYSRCPISLEACRAGVPPMIEVGDAHYAACLRAREAPAMAGL